MTGSVEGMCPRCLLSDAWADDSSSGGAGGGKDDIANADYSLEYLRPLFPNLEIKELIERGGMGAVYLVRQKGLNRLACLKVLSPSLANDPEFVERFRLEAEAIGQLNHPHIVTVFDASKVEDVLYILMEYVEGSNLKQYSQDHALSSDEVIGLLQQVASGLAVAHDRKIIHRDIKPANILIEALSGKAKLSDFGLAKLEGASLLSGLTSVSLTIGTPRYMAPEQWESAREADRASDIYAMGVVFYELATGAMPTGRFEVPSKLTDGRYSSHFDQIICKALASKPEDRYRNAGEMCRAVADGNKVSSFSKRTRLTIGLASLGIAATVGFSFFLASPLGKKRPLAGQPIPLAIVDPAEDLAWKTIYTAKAQYFRGSVAEGSLGRSLAILDDRVIAGAPQGGIKRNDITGSGYVMIKRTRNDPTSDRMEFDRSAPIVLTAADSDWGDMFGYELATSRIEEEGQQYVVIGSPGRHHGTGRKGENSGRAIVYYGDGGRWRMATELGAGKDRQSTIPALYGYAVAASGKLTVVGAPGFCAGKDSGTGAVGFYEYQESNGQWIEQWIEKPPPLEEPEKSRRAEMDFGSTVALDERFVIIGSPRDSQGKREQGRVFVYERASDRSWKVKQELVDFEPKWSEQFGFRVALHGQWLLATSYSTRLGDDSYPIGHVSIFRLREETDQWEYHQTLKIHADELRAGLELERFGYGIAVNSEFIAIGAPTTLQSGVPHHGLVFVYKFDPESETWKSQTQILPRVGKTRFGVAVEFGKDFLAVGSIFFLPTGANSNSGGVFCFDLKNFE
ncbi:MAG: hypothetical protein ACI9R3_003834 [Verrucomicrobiales bacterium]|jgi:hypothetical protein